MSESGPQSQPDDVTVDLLIKQVTEGLSPDEQRALDAMDGAAASAYLRDFERAAAAISLAGSANAAAPPASLRLLLEQQAQKFFETAPASAAATGAAANVVDFRAARTASARPRSNSGAYGWFAAAASLVLALFGWLRAPSPVAPIAEVVVPPAVVAPPVQQPVAPPTAAEERAALLMQPESLKVTLAATKDPAGTGVTGDVVWDPATQRGYLRFVGLAPNDPRIRQYQLWIFDGGRDKRYPVDGGVFDIPANSGEVVIPIHAALAVLKPAAFAVTIEKPGGVVVSGREHVVVLGAAG